MRGCRRYASNGRMSCSLNRFGYMCEVHMDIVVIRFNDPKIRQAVISTSGHYEVEWLKCALPWSIEQADQNTLL